jgi:hypothetical protein
MTFSAIVNIAFGYDFAFNFFPIFKGLRGATDKRMQRACFFGLLECAIPYVLMAFSGCFLTG